MSARIVIRSTVAAAAAGLILLPGCSATPSPVSDRVSTVDGTTNSHAGAPGRVIATFNTEASLKEFYPDITDMLNSKRLVAVVTGTVIGTSYTYKEYVARTKLKVNVTKTIWGDAPKTIAVWEDGGYVPAKLVEQEIKEKYPELQGSATDSDVVDMTFEGARHAKVGDEVLLFLTKNPNANATGSYFTVSSVYGVLLKAGSNYERMTPASPNIQHLAAYQTIVDAAKKKA